LASIPEKSSQETPGSDKLAWLLDFVHGSLPIANGCWKCFRRIGRRGNRCPSRRFFVPGFKYRQAKKLHLIDPWKHEESNTYKEAMYGGKAGGGQAEMDNRCDSVRRRFDSEIRSGQIVIHRDFSSNVLAYFQMVTSTGCISMAIIFMNLSGKTWNFP